MKFSKILLLFMLGIALVTVCLITADDRPLDDGKFATELVAELSVLDFETPVSIDVGKAKHADANIQGMVIDIKLMHENTSQKAASYTNTATWANQMSRRPRDGLTCDLQS